MSCFCGLAQLWNVKSGVDFIVCPFGSLTVKGLMVKVLFKHGAFDRRKCPVQPESTRAVSLCLSGGGVRQSSNFSLLFLDVTPTSQSLLTWYPPLLLAFVASRWCPSFGYIHVWLVWVRATL
jgi:hypothetical protein